MLIKTHKETNQTLLTKRAGSVVSSFYLLDNNNNKIKDGVNVHGLTSYKTVVCLNKSV